MLVKMEQSGRVLFRAQTMPHAIFPGKVAGLLNPDIVRVKKLHICRVALYCRCPANDLDLLAGPWHIPQVRVQARTLSLLQVLYRKTLQEYTPNLKTSLEERCHNVYGHPRKTRLDSTRNLSSLWQATSDLLHRGHFPTMMIHLLMIRIP